MRKGILFPCDVLEQFPCIFPCERGKCQGCPIIAAKRNPFRFPHLHDSAFYDCSAWITFWDLCELEWAEHAKFELYYDAHFSTSDEEEEEESCDYTGEECCGNKLFCEECSVLTEELDEK